MGHVKFVIVVVVSGALAFLVAFAVARYNLAGGNFDRHREPCKAALAIAAHSVNPLRVVGHRSGQGARVEWDWELRFKRVNPHDAYVLVEGISPHLLDGSDSVYVKTGWNEKTFRTHRSSSDKISFRQKLSYGVVSDEWLPIGVKRMDFAYPVRGNSRISQVDGKRTLLGAQTHSADLKHAVDMRAEMGAVVVNGMDGIVVHAADGFSDDGCYLPELEGRSNLVVVRHANGTEALYGHLMQNSIRVSIGERIRAGEPIARVGNSGKSSLPHLHLQVGGLTGEGYKTIPLTFHGCTGRGRFLPSIARVTCD